MKQRRLWLRALSATALLWIAGCAQPPKGTLLQDPASPIWRGRLALRVAGDPPQSFFAGFELRGDATQGELRLYSPLGATLAELRWSPQAVTLADNAGTRTFDSLDSLTAQATGAALPIQALFQWLTGTQARVDGWDVDLSQLEEAGRLTARRTPPEPATELRLILER